MQLCCDTGLLNATVVRIWDMRLFLRKIVGILIALGFSKVTDLTEHVCIHIYAYMVHCTGLQTVVLVSNNDYIML